MARSFLCTVVRLGTFLLILAILVTTGCTSSGPSSAWVRQQGGIITDARQAQADAALLRLVAGHSELHAVVRVLDSESLVAYSWPDGHIFVTTGLIDRTNQEELVAALAHEFGHLLKDGRERVITSLRGSAQPVDAEARADAIGMGLLRLQGLPEASMTTLLEKVKASLPPCPCRDGIEHRILLLRQCPTEH